jgi:hypothetical protein
VRQTLRAVERDYLVERDYSTDYLVERDYLVVGTPLVRAADGVGCWRHMSAVLCSLLATRVSCGD